jgi:predicted phage-related endonuclease
MKMSEGIVYHNDVIQNTDEWLLMRKGIVTASEVSNLLTPTLKLATGAKVNAYACEIAAQIMDNHLEENYESYDMMRGHIQEEYARNYYSQYYALVTECGFVTNDSFGFVIGCSPDGLVGDDGGIEIKSRKSKFQVQTILANEVPAEYMLQIQTTLLVTGRKWWDFVQYSNGMPLFVKRVFPDIEIHDKIIEAVREFYGLVDKVLAMYKTESAAYADTEWVEICLDEITPSDEVE